MAMKEIWSLLEPLAASQAILFFTLRFSLASWIYMCNFHFGYSYFLPSFT